MRRKVKDTIIKTVTAIMAILFILSAGCLDTPNTNVPTIMCFVSVTWLFLFVLANGERMMK
jgi:hypothetical protein